MDLPICLSGYFERLSVFGLSLGGAEGLVTGLLSCRVTEGLEAGKDGLSETSGLEGLSGLLTSGLPGLLSPGRPMIGLGRAILGRGSAMFGLGTAILGLGCMTSGRG